MRHLFVMDPLATVLPDKDSTFALMCAAHARGDSVDVCLPSDLRWTVDGVAARVTRVVPRDGIAPVAAEPPSDALLTVYGCVWMRKDPPVDAGFVFACQLLELAARQGVRVVNRPDSVYRCNEKLYALEFPTLVPPTLVTARLTDIRNFARTHTTVVLKPLGGNGGRGVFVCTAEDSNLGPAWELLSKEGEHPIVAQRFIPEIRAGDKRIILIQGEVAGAVVRVPQSGDHRANMHVGGQAQACTLSERDLEICAHLGPSLRERGLGFVGIDVIGDWLTEINVTSPTGAQEIRRLQGVDVAALALQKLAN